MCDPDDLGMMLTEGIMFSSITNNDEDENDMDPCSKKHKHHHY